MQRVKSLDGLTSIINNLYFYYSRMKTKILWYFQFLWKYFLSGFIFALWIIAAVLWVSAFQNMTTSPGDSWNTSLSAPMLSRLWGTFDRETMSLEAISKRNNKRRLFVTLTSYSGNLGWPTGADTKCQAEANTYNLWWTWKALIDRSDLHSVVWYDWNVLVNVVWAPLTEWWKQYCFGNGAVNSTAGSVSCYYAASIPFNPFKYTYDTTYTIFSNYILSPNWSNPNSTVWTWLNAAWASTGNNCSNWSSNSSWVNWWVWGSTRTDYRWINQSTMTCNNSYNLYCIEQ
jgi:hypothetical protein